MQSAPMKNDTVASDPFPFRAANMHVAPKAANNENKTHPRKRNILFRD